MAASTGGRTHACFDVESTPTLIEENDTSTPGLRRDDRRRSGEVAVARTSAGPAGLSVCPYDVVVCGAGPAGVAAAIAAGRAGARTLLVEPQNALGGVWTSGLLSNILDSHNKPGIMSEIRERLRARGAVADIRDLYDAEVMKLVLEELCAEAGVTILLHAKVSDAVVAGRLITQVVLECKEGRRTVSGCCFVDATGDGDLSARAGCGFDLGRDVDGVTQPQSLMSLLIGVPDYVRNREDTGEGTASCLKKADFLNKLREAGWEPSYTQPSLFPLPNGFCALMADHQYGHSGLESMGLTSATLQARKEIFAIIEAMKRFGDDWKDVRLVTTAAHIGVREGRRIHGLYRIGVEDVSNGARHADAITRCTFGIDVHSPKRDEGGGYDAGGVSRALPYDIPLRALIARDRDNLLMAGRCISGDFHAHASYRVTGNAVATGEAAGTAAALAAREKLAPSAVPTTEVLHALEVLRKDAVVGV